MIDRLASTRWATANYCQTEWTSPSNGPWHSSGWLELVYQRAAGFADREAQIPMRENTVFRLSSLTKPIVSAAAMALVERKLLDLDDTAVRWLPQFRPKTPEGAEAVITLRQLLTHTAGLNYGFFEQ